MWKLEDEEVRASWKAKAEVIKQEHKSKHPDYTYQPRKAGEKKRRMTKRKLAALSDANEQIALVNLAAPSPTEFNTPPIANEHIMGFLPMKPGEPMERQFDMPQTPADILQFDQDLHTYNTSQGLLEPEGPLIAETSFTSSVFNDHFEDIVGLNSMFPFDLGCELFDLNQSIPTTNDVLPSISADLIHTSLSTTLDQLSTHNDVDQSRMRTEMERQETLDALAMENWGDFSLE
jgi:hypothetical protein